MTLLSEEELETLYNNGKCQEVIKQIFPKSGMANTIGALLEKDKEVKNYLTVGLDNPEFDYALVLVKRGKELPKQALVDALWFSMEGNEDDKN